MAYSVYTEKDAESVENRDPIKPLSRYNKIRLYIDDNKNVVQESWDGLNLQESDLDKYITVKPEWQYRPDLIAERFLGSKHLYWVIAWANQMMDPFAETYPKRRLLIPDPASLYLNVQ